MPLWSSTASHKSFPGLLLQKPGPSCAATAASAATTPPRARRRCGNSSDSPTMAEPSLPSGVGDEPSIAIDDLPLECLVEVFECLANVKDLLSCAAVSQLFKEVAMSDCLWRSLCVRGQHGGSLDFKEMLGCFSHPDARPLSTPDEPAPPVRRSSSSSSAAGKSWIEVFKLSTESLKSTICIDTGRGYAKYGLASAAGPEQIQICQPRAEATQDSLFPLAFRRLELRRCDLPNMAMIVAEPFRLAAASEEAERQAWRYHMERRVLQGFQLKRICIVDSASLCLFANKLTSGVVVNIGFGAIFVVPVLGGRIVRSAVRTQRLGGASLTQLFAELLSHAGIDTEWHESMGGEPLAEITVARNIKERGCEVWPTPLRERFGRSPFALAHTFSRTDAPPKQVQLGEASFDLGWERFLPAEMLFEPQEMVPGARGGIHDMVLRCVDATVAAEVGSGSDEEQRKLRHDLLGRVVLSGGSAAMPGLGERLKFELTRVLEAEPGAVPTVRVYPAQRGDHTTWLGASVLAGTSTFAEHWCVHAPTAPPPRFAADDDDEDDDDDDDEKEEDEEEEEDEDEDSEDEGDDDGEEEEEEDEDSEDEGDDDGEEEDDDNDDPGGKVGNGDEDQPVEEQAEAMAENDTAEADGAASSGSGPAAQA